MKILYDYQVFNQIIGGASNCFVELISHLPDNIKYEIGIRESNNKHLREKSLINNLKKNSLCQTNFILPYHFPGQYRLYSFFNNKFKNFPSSEHKNRDYSIKLLQSQDFDIFHPTDFNPYFLKYIGNKPFVLTIHDLIADRFYASNNKQTLWRKQLVDKAAHIVAVSEKTKEDIIDLLKIQEDKISVIYHGVSIPHNLNLEKRIINDKYFLFVGRRKGYKNFIPMIKALSPFLQTHKDYKLVCTANDFTKEELKLFKDLKIKDSIIHKFVSYNEMLNLYRYATAFIYPSLYEGFGIPILEAYSMECPVLLSNYSCFPEIAQDAALYFNLDENSNSLTDLINKVHNMSKEEKKTLINKQNKRLSNFSWEKSAKELSNVYENLYIR